MRVYLAADHGGFNLKEALKAHLLTQGHEVIDEGADTLDPADDYPDFMYPAAQKVAADMDSRGIFFCRSGAGAAIVANKVKGVRAVVARSVEDATQARDIVSAFLSTPFSGEDRHLRRLKKLIKIEQGA